MRLLLVAVLSIAWCIQAKSDCATGFHGPACEVCQTDEACQAKGFGESAKCLTTNVITTDLKLKSYTCDLAKGSPLTPILGNTGFWGKCEIPEKSCQLNFASENASEPHVQCQTSNCTIGSVSGADGRIDTQVSCDKAKCGPAGDMGWPKVIPAFIRGPLNGTISGGISLECKGGGANNTNGSDCTVKVAEIPFPINILCTFGDCIDETDAQNASLVKVEKKKNKKDEDAAYNSLPVELVFLPILLIILAAFIICCMIFTELKKQYLRVLYDREVKKVKGKDAKTSLSSIPGAPNDIPPSSDEFYAPEMASSDRHSELNMNMISELSFNKIVCDVFAAPDDDKWLESRGPLNINSSLKRRVQLLNYGLQSSFKRLMNSSKKKSRSSSSSASRKASKAKKKSIEFAVDLEKTIEASEEYKSHEYKSQEFKSHEYQSHEYKSDLPLTKEEEYMEKARDEAKEEVIYQPKDDEDEFSEEVWKQHWKGNDDNGSHNTSSSAHAHISSKLSNFQVTLQRTASRVKEAMMSLKKGKKRILHGITGSVNRGNMLAVMGPSGCGKSSLLNILAGESAGERVTGVVSIDGKERQGWFRHITVYIPQSDELIPILTVRESIIYSGKLRLPWYYSTGRKLKKVNEVLEQLKIQHVAESQVGGSCGVRGISGGERRRVSIGMGLVADPKVMILDEPTSGLDAAAASSIVKTLKELAAKGEGRIVIASLHQPNNETFMELDLLLLLGKGRQVYFGPAKGIGDFFSSRGFPCPKGLAIADYMLHIVSDLDCLREVLNIQEGKNFNASTELESSFSKESEDEEHKKTLDNLWKVEMYRPKTTELMVLIRRSMRQIWRRPLLFRLQLILAIICAILSIAMFHNMERDIAGVQNRLGFFFFQMAFFGFAGISSTDLILEERSVFLREIHGKFYSPITYYLSKVIVDGVMLRMLPIIVYDLMVYWSIGLRSGYEHILVYFISTVLFSLATGALSIAITMGSKTGGVASLGIILVLLFSILFGGFLSNRGAIPSWIGWIQYLSIYYQVMGVVLSNEVRGTEFSTTISKGVTIKVSADDLLEKINFALEPNVTIYIGCLTALYVGWVIIGYITMKIFLSDGTWWRKIFPKSRAKME